MSNETSATVSEAEALINAYGNAQFECGEYPRGENYAPYETFTAKADVAKQALLAYIQGLEARITALTPLTAAATKTAIQQAADEATGKFRESLAEAEFEAYDFGEGITVESYDGWSRSGNEWTRVVYAKYSEDHPERETHRIRFYVRFATAATLDDVFARECDCGGDIGTRGTVQAPQATD